MDFTGRSSQPPQPGNPGPQFSAAPANATNNKKTNKPAKRSKLVSYGAGALGLLVVLLVAALILTISFGNANSENSYVDKNKLQAVFLNTGQVYFGNVKTLNNKYFVLDNIYYLQTSNGGSATSASTTAANTSVSLVKLGCELHAPYDQMVINRDQVTFWENLQSDGQVAKAVATFQKDNPNGQKCADQSSAASTNTNVQGGTTNTSTPSATTTTPTTTTKK